MQALALTVLIPGKTVQRQHGHLWPQVRTANADVDDVGDLRIGPNLLGVGQHGCQRGVHQGQRIGNFIITHY